MWVFLVAVVAAAGLGNVEPLQPVAAAFIADGTITAPVSIVAMLTVAFAAVAWRVEAAVREREEEAILRDKPALSGDKTALARERRIRRKELVLQLEEEKAIKRESQAERLEAKAERDEDEVRRRRELLHAKREELREREALGR
jgi:hypothetical protein